MDNTEVRERILTFLKNIGIGVELIQVDTETFVPGVWVERGRLHVDLNKLMYPGDLLHEAGHIAVVPAAERISFTGNADENKSAAQSLEIAAICWSYAALVALNLPPDVVFHEGGYRGASSWYIENYISGNYLGLPLLQWMGLCRHQQDRSGLPAFPYMIKWLRD